MAKFDLTTRNLQFLDRHLTFPLLEFLLSKDVSAQLVKLLYLHKIYELSTIRNLNFMFSIKSF